MADGTTVDGSQRAEQRTAPAPPPPPPPPKPEPVKEAAARDDKVTGDTAAIEAQGREGQRLLDTQAKLREPAMPGGDVAATEKAPLAREHQAKSDELRARFNQPIDKLGDTMKQRGDKAGALREATDYAAKIEDKQQREQFVASLASDAGKAAGDVRHPAAIQQLQKLGEHGSMDSARKMAEGADKAWTDGAMPYGTTGDSQVAKAMKERQQGRIERAGDAAATVAKTVVPFVDAASKLKDGDVKGALKSAAVDAAAIAAGALIGKGIVAAAPAIKSAVKSLFGKADDVARGADDAVRATQPKPKVEETPPKPAGAVEKAADGTPLTDNPTRRLAGKPDAQLKRPLTKEESKAVVDKVEADRKALSAELGREIPADPKRPVRHDAVTSDPAKSEKLAAHQLMQSAGPKNVVVGENNVRAALGQPLDQSRKVKSTDLLRKEKDGFTPIEVKNETTASIDHALSKFKEIEATATKAKDVKAYEVMIGEHTKLPPNFRVDSSGRLYTGRDGSWVPADVGGKPVTIRRAYLGEVGT